MEELFRAKTTEVMEQIKDDKDNFMSSTMLGKGRRSEDRSYTSVATNAVRQVTWQKIISPATEK